MECIIITLDSIILGILMMNVQQVAPTPPTPPTTPPTYQLQYVPYAQVAVQQTALYDSVIDLPENTPNAINVKIAALKAFIYEEETALSQAGGIPSSALLNAAQIKLIALQAPVHTAVAPLAQGMNEGFGQYGLFPPLDDEPATPPTTPMAAHHESVSPPQTSITP